MTIKDISEKMDAAELMEWMAYFMLQDEKEAARLHQDIKEEMYPGTTNKEMKSFFSHLLSSRRKVNGTT